MATYLVDAHLPQTLNTWKNEEFIYVMALGIERNDTIIWNFAKDHSLTILTRDKDFADRIIYSEPPPKVIHFKLGNIRYPDFRIFIKENWNKISLYSMNFKLVLVYPGSIEGIK